MLSTVIKKIKQYYKKEIDVYCGDLLALTINKKLFTPYKGGRKLDFRQAVYKKEYLKNSVIKLDNIPYLDNDTPTILITDKENQLIEMIYLLDGLGCLYRNERELPSLMKFKDGSIIEEEYSLNRHNMKIRYGYSFYTIPAKMVYQQGLINDEESNWIRWSLDGDLTIIPHADYRELIKEALNINIDNFKNFTLYERMAINMYMTPENYEMKLKEFDIEPNQESVKNNLKLLEMIYI